MSAHGAATALNRESLSFFLYIFVYMNVCLPVHETHKYFLVWEHVVSAHGAATALNREYPGMFFCFLLFILNYIFLFMKRINIFLFGSMLCQIMEKIRP